MSGLTLVNHAELQKYVRKIFEAAGLKQAAAEIVAENLVLANLRGLDTHGVVRVKVYIDRLKRGLVNADPSIRIQSAVPAVLQIDGDNGFGAIVCHEAAIAAAAAARTYGIAAAAIRQSNHFGAASVNVLDLAEAGMVCVLCAPASKSLAPFGSSEPLFGTNPIAVVSPAGRHSAWCMDMASSVAARGRIRLAHKQGRRIPEGWALNEGGEPTTDPGEALRGVMLPFAGPKGSAIAMMVEILGGVLVGGRFGGDIGEMTTDLHRPQGVGHLLLCLNVEAFMPLSEFNSRMEELIARMKRLKLAAGADDVFYPGEIEAGKAADRRQKGIPLARPLLQELVALGRDLGLHSELVQE